jgi:putative transposase
VRFVFIHAERANYPLTILCRVLEVSRSGYHAWVRREPSKRKVADARLAAEAAAIHRRSRATYGSPRVHAELASRGHRVGRKRVARLMRQCGLQARRKRRFRKTTDSNHHDPIAPNLVARNFTATAPNQVWVTDVTAISTGEGWLFLAVILDLFSRRAVGWAVSAQNDTALALDALRRAWRQRRPPRGLVHHSDRGSPYASADYRRALRGYGMVASMSRKGDCWDNAVAESFFATLRAELVDYADYPTRQVAVASIGEYIDGFYNLSRRHSTLGYLNPIEYELRSHQQRGAA